MTVRPLSDWRGGPGVCISVWIVRRDEYTPDSCYERRQAEDDQQEPVQDTRDLPPLLSNDLSSLLRLVFLLHDDGTQVSPRILLLLEGKQVNITETT